MEFWVLEFDQISVNLFRLEMHKICIKLKS